MEWEIFQLQQDLVWKLEVLIGASAVVSTHFSPTFAKCKAKLIFGQIFLKRLKITVMSVSTAVSPYRIEWENFKLHDLDCKVPKIQHFMRVKQNIEVLWTLVSSTA